jgi:hypothetical protein
MKFFRYFPKIQYDLDGNNYYREVVNLFRASKIVSGIDDDISFYRTYTIQDGERPDHISTKLYGTHEYYWTFFVINEKLKNAFNDWPGTVKEVEDYVKETYTGQYIAYSGNDLYDKFVVGETIRGFISGATAEIVDKSTDLGWIRVTNVNGAFKVGELIRGDTTLDSIDYFEGMGEFYNAAHSYVNATGDTVTRFTPNASLVSNYDYEVQRNEEKRDIRVIRPEYIGRVKRQFRDSING